MVACQIGEVGVPYSTGFRFMIEFQRTMQSVQISHVSDQSPAQATWLFLPIGIVVLIKV